MSAPRRPLVLVMAGGTGAGVAVKVTGTSSSAMTLPSAGERLTARMTPGPSTGPGKSEMRHSPAALAVVGRWARRVPSLL